MRNLTLASSLLAASLASLAVAQIPQAETRTVNVALCQVLCLDGDRAGNFVRIENAMAEAKEKGAEIACFPESTVLGWINPDAHQRAHPIPGPDSDRLCELARKYRMHVCIGLDEKDGTNLYDAALLISDEGDLLLKHRKMHNLDDLHLITPPYAAGTEVQVAETRLGRIGVMICADTFMEEFLKRMADLAPDLVLIPYGWVAKEDAWPGHGRGLVDLVRRVAQVVGAPAVGTDPIGQVTHGPWAGLNYGGFSTVADQRGRTLAVAKDRDRDVLVVPVKVGRQPASSASSP